MRTAMPIQHRTDVAAFVPWSIFTPEDDAQAKRNHDQSLDELAARQGVSICELVAILDHRPWRAMRLSEGWERLFQIFAERSVTFEARH